MAKVRKKAGYDMGQDLAYLVRCDKRLEDAEEDVGCRRRILAKVLEDGIVGRLSGNPLVVECLDALTSVGKGAEHPLRVAVARDGLVQEVRLDLAVNLDELLGEVGDALTNRLEFV